MNNLCNKPKNYSDTNSNYNQHLFEQYKVYVEMADRISQRRMTTNTFFLSINSTMITVFTFLQINNYANALYIMILGCLSSFTWWNILNSYKKLNSAKYKVICEIEKQLPLMPYTCEWAILNNNKEQYSLLTYSEKLLPLLFIAIYVFPFIIKAIK